MRKLLRVWYRVVASSLQGDPVYCDRIVGTRCYSNDLPRNPCKTRTKNLQIFPLVNRQVNQGIRSAEAKLIGVKNPICPTISGRCTVSTRSQLVLGRCSGARCHSILRRAAARVLGNGVAWRLGHLCCLISRSASMLGHRRSVLRPNYLLSRSSRSFPEECAVALGEWTALVCASANQVAHKLHCNGPRGFHTAWVLVWQDPTHMRWFLCRQDAAQPDSTPAGLMSAGCRSPGLPV